MAGMKVLGALEKVRYPFAGEEVDFGLWAVDVDLLKKGRDLGCISQSAGPIYRDPLQLVGGKFGKGHADARFENDDIPMRNSSDKRDLAAYGIGICNVPMPSLASRFFPAPSFP